MKSKSGRHSHSGAPPMFNPKSHDAEHRKNPGRVSHASKDKEVRTTHEARSFRDKAPREDHR
jgi:hypothetical protein